MLICTHTSDGIFIGIALNLHNYRAVIYMIVVCCLVTQSDSFVTPWTVARQASLCMGFSRQEYWSGLQFPSPEDLPKPGTEPESLALQADSLPFKLQGSPEFFFFLTIIPLLLRASFFNHFVYLFGCTRS